LKRMLYGQIRRRSIDYSTPKFDGKVKSPISALRFISCSLRRT
jgi:hypothetical protein